METCKILDGKTGTVASLTGSGINGNGKRKNNGSGNYSVASLTGSGINGNKEAI